MKQTFAVIIFLVLAALGFIYLFIPGKLSPGATVVTACNKGSVERLLSNAPLRRNWMPADFVSNGMNSYSNGDWAFTFSADNFFNNTIAISNGSRKYYSQLTPFGWGDSCRLQWQFSFASSKQPLARVLDYFTARKIESLMKEIMQHLAAYAGQTKNIYEISIERTHLYDSSLITLRGTASNYPDVAAIYKSISQLQEYAAQNGAAATNPPMLNILPDGKDGWQYMVALPVNKLLPNHDPISSKLMLPGGFFLASENIKGGFHTVDHYLQQMENYKSDYNYSSPPIPFQSLITDRSKEADTSKWITRLYYPVF